MKLPCLDSLGEKLNCYRSRRSGCSGLRGVLYDQEAVHGQDFTIASFWWEALRKGCIEDTIGRAVMRCIGVDVCTFRAHSGAGYSSNGRLCKLVQIE